MTRNDLLFSIPLGDWVDSIVRWMIRSWDAFFDVIGDILTKIYEAIYWVLATPPFWAIIIVFALLAFFAKGWKLAVGTVLGFLLVYGMFQWDNAMTTLALVIEASVIATLFGVPWGIAAARVKWVSRITRPIMDFLQSMPAFVYLIPFVMIFSAGIVPGIVSTVLFAIPPAVRFTELGIRQVDESVVEASYAFGATPGRVLRQVQLPLAMPTIMGGINQVIMLSLSMVVIAGMVGGGGLGNAVVASIQRVNISLGAEAGLSVVILAMFLDRVTSAFGNKTKRSAKN
ncbi:ABC-type proline/glycine betaine transport system permease subunit [Trueperella bonasi]|uniref:ABC-type proline/glycine betaine transport system permease subunit n=1 Tax=Trueperella bonasi TaxID=312286 RepID=A0ABT9NFU6_9ACTO|nr:ABC transporter permease subunit [Trueperella bonasi]MDP9806274.1 ABC-type proline/glycine betaine transport system permease subunit [Trueperella bonasi]